MMTFQHNIYLLGGEEVDAESPTGSRTVNRWRQELILYQVKSVIPNQTIICMSKSKSE